MPFFKNVFKSRDGPRSGSKAGKFANNDASPVAQPKPRWEESWSRRDVAPEEIQELVHVCTHEMKTRGLDMPLMLLPFRPASDLSGARNFVRNFFKASYEGTRLFTGEALQQELRLTEPLVLCSIIKWCWGRLPRGVVTWDAYELFRIGESDSNYARHAFDTFIPLSVDSEARRQIIVDFFDLLAAVAARSKSNGMGGRKLSRMAGWWAFEHTDDGKGFDGGYRSWEKAADAASHLFFAYLRSLSPDPHSVGAISGLPRSLQALLSQTEYPPETPLLMQTATTKVVMIVDAVSPTPFALLRRAKHFEYRDDDAALQQFSAYEDTVKALTEECRRVLECISATNQSAVAVPATGNQDASWSRFEDLGFSAILDTPTNGSDAQSTREFSSLKSGPRSRNADFGRPTTPSWADFLSSGFADENGEAQTQPFLLPPGKMLPPIGEASRVHSSQSHIRHGIEAEYDLEPGELASITQFDLDDTFWWVWMTSLAAEEPTQRKAVFGRCTLIETRIPGAKWLVMEEQVKGASHGPEEGAYIAEKKGRFSFRTRLGRRKSTNGRKPPTLSKDPYNRTTANTPLSKTSIAPDQHARIQAAAARLAQDQRDEDAPVPTAHRRARIDDAMSTKTNSVLTLQPHLLTDAAPAMKWDKKFGEGARDKDALRAHYLGDMTAGRGSHNNLMVTANGGTSTLANNLSDRDLPALPKDEVDTASSKRDATPPPAPIPLISPPVPASKSQTWDPSPIVQAGTPSKLPTTSVVLDDKPIPNDELDTHPAFRKPVPERKPIAPPKQDTPVEEPAPVPDHVKKSPPKKLKKPTGGGGGFRKLFGKKKVDAPVVAEPAVPAYVSQADTGRYTPQPESDPTPPREPSPVYSAGIEDSVRGQSTDIEHTPARATASHHYQHDYQQRDYDQEDYADNREANQEFSRFDQGPMDDMPAFAPDDDSEGEHAAAPSASQPAYREITTPTRRAPEPPADDASEQSIDLSRQVSPSMDRWAQIRKNAAERAARVSEEQSRRSQSQSARTDEGETSGEETIESRVARIKARVAELTGTMDGQQADR